MNIRNTRIGFIICDFLHRVTFEMTTDIHPDSRDEEFTYGIRKPTRFARIMDRITMGPMR